CRTTSLSRLRRPRCFLLFPYTTLFRSHAGLANSCWTAAGSWGYPLANLRAAAAHLRRSSFADYLRSRGLGNHDPVTRAGAHQVRSEEHTSELQSPDHLVGRRWLEERTH